MGIINDYSMHIVMDGDQKEVLREIVRDRAFALVELDISKNERAHEKSFGYVDSYYHIGIRAKNSKIPFKECGCFINLARERGKESEGYFRSEMDSADKKDGVAVSYPNLDDLLSCCEGKELVFQVDFIEENGNVEEVIWNKFLDNVFLLDEGDPFLLYDGFYDIRFFFQNTSVDKEVTALTPTDIRDFDVNNVLLEHLGKLSDIFAEKERNDIAFTFSMVSEKIQAQYFVTRFHSNPNWEADPVCIFRFRISAFILPGTTKKTEGKMPDKKTARKLVNESNYKIDSIHFNSDICSDMNEIKELLKGHFYDVDFA